MVVLVAYQHHQYSSQAQQLAAAREDLRLKAEAAAAQQSRLAELQQQNSSISATRGEMEQELARLRARRKATDPARRWRLPAGRCSPLFCRTPPSGSYYASKRSWVCGIAGRRSPGN